MDKLYLSPPEVEQLYGIRVNTLAAWRSRGQGPDFFKMGKVIRYSQEEMEEFVQGHRVRCFRKGES